MKKTSLIASVLLATVLAAAGSVAVAATSNSGNSGNSGGSGGSGSGGSSNSGQSAGLASGDDCFTAVYDQQNDEGTYAHYGKGSWDADRQLCKNVGAMTQSYLKNVTAIDAAKANPFIHVMYVIDRTQDKLYAPCGANSDSAGVLGPGTYDLNSLTKVDSQVPNLGPGANCLITG